MIIIGEKINGFVPRTGQAIEEKDGDYIQMIAKQQSEAGADFLDCCPATDVGALETMKWMVDLIEEVSDTPICLDSPGADVLVESFGFVSRPGMINSVSIAGDKIEKIFPLIKGTDWKVVAMLDDEEGIPETAEGRVDCFKRLLGKMEEYDIKPDQVFIDPLVETLGTNEESLITFAKVCRDARELCPDIHITSGLSNISFGLPSRKSINMGFMVLAMQAGMDSAIVDPLNRDMMGLIYATDALLGNDEYCMEYLTAYREGLFGPAPKE